MTDKRPVGEGGAMTEWEAWLELARDAGRERRRLEHGGVCR